MSIYNVAKFPTHIRNSQATLKCTFDLCLYTYLDVTMEFCGQICWCKKRYNNHKL